MTTRRERAEMFLRGQRPSPPEERIGPLADYLSGRRELEAVVGTDSRYWSDPVRLLAAAHLCSSFILSESEHGHIDEE